MRTAKHCPTHDQGKGKVLPISQFHYDRDALDGHQSRCKECLNSARRNRYVRDGPSPRDLYSVVRGNACRKGIPFELSFEDFIRLIAQPCIYGGGTRPAFNIGVDRKNPTGAYELNNLVPSCWRHNEFKRDLLKFESMVRIVAEFEEVKECGDFVRKRERKFLRRALAS